VISRSKWLVLLPLFCNFARFVRTVFVNAALRKVFDLSTMFLSGDELTLLLID
jgi:hypothetical protein